MRLACILSFSVLATVGSAHAAGSSDAEQLTRDNQLIRARAALLAAGDPDSLLAATASYLGTKQHDGAERLALITRAAAAAPGRPELAWWHLQLCVTVPACDVKPIEATLQALDPKNAAGWSGSLMRSAAAHDDAGVHAAMSAMAGAERFDIYWNQLASAMANAFIRTGMEAKTGFLVALGASAAQGLPFKPLADTCKASSPKHRELVITCRQLSEVLRRGDTYATETIGLSLARYVWAEGSDEWAAAARDYHTVKYRSGEDNRLLEKQPFGNAFAERRLALLATHRTEQEVVLADLAAAGVNPDPPPSHGIFYAR